MFDFNTKPTLPPALAHRGAGEPPGAVAAIGRRLHALSVENNACDKAAVEAPDGSPARQEAEDRMNAIFLQEIALREQVAALPAETLADVATQALACGLLADRMVGADRARLLRMSASMAVAAAGIGHFDLARLVEDGRAPCCARVLAEPAAAGDTACDPDGGARETNKQFVQRILLTLLDSGMLSEEAEELVGRAAQCEGLVA